jgi:hypothetical protein
METTEHQVMRALVDWINENEHQCPGCHNDVSADKVNLHRIGCPVLTVLLLATGPDVVLQREFEL